MTCFSHVIVWDIETVPGIKGFAAANGLDGKCENDIRASMGDKFQKHIYHSIICIGALIAHPDDQWQRVVSVNVFATDHPSVR